MQNSRLFLHIVTNGSVMPNAAMYRSTDFYKLKHIIHQIAI